MNILYIALYIFLLLNIVAAAAFVYDKRRAIKGEWRVPEITLLILALVGPFGAAIAMNIFHHKTQKPKFKLVYVFVILHIIVIFALIQQNYF